MGAKRVTPEEIETFFDLYDKYGTYAEVARRTGRSAKTISKYVSDKGAYRALKAYARQKNK